VTYVYCLLCNCNLLTSVVTVSYWPKLVNFGSVWGKTAVSVGFDFLMNYGFFAPLLVHPLACSLPGSFAP